ncbi:FAD-dependent monooxygenase [Mariniluteicoccus flavus]
MLDAAVPVEVERHCSRIDDPAALDGDLLVGADGAHSIVRKHVWGQGSRPTGTLALRGVVAGEVTDINPGQVGLHEFWGRGLLFGMSPNSGGTTNWYAAMHEFDTDPAAGISWAREHFADFPAPVLRVLERADPAATVVNRVVEAPRLASLVRGRHVLVGDAAHVMSPNLGRGACEALVDAVTLAEELSTNPLGQALRAYQRRRLLPGQGIRVASAAVRPLALG